MTKLNRFMIVFARLSKTICSIIGNCAKRVFTNSPIAIFQKSKNRKNQSHERSRKRVTPRRQQRHAPRSTRRLWRLPCRFPQGDPSGAALRPALTEAPASAHAKACRLRGECRSMSLQGELMLQASARDPLAILARPGGTCKIQENALRGITCNIRRNRAFQPLRSRAI